MLCTKCINVPNGPMVPPIPGLGKLVLVQRKARMGRNPATGETIKIKAKKVVKLRRQSREGCDTECVRSDPLSSKLNKKPVKAFDIMSDMTYIDL